MENNEKNEEFEIDLGQLFKLLLKNLKLIILSTLVCAIVAFAFTFFFVDKKYASQALIYLMPKVNEQGVVDANQQNLNSKLVNNYMTIMGGETILSKVSDSLDLDNVAEVKGSLSISNPANTETIRVKATTKDPKKSQEIVSNTIDVFFAQMKDQLKLENMTIIDPPKVETAAVSPNIKMNTVIGALGGVLLSGGYVLLKFLFDKRLRTREEAENFLGIPVLVEVPFFEES